MIHARKVLIETSTASSTCHTWSPSGVGRNICIPTDEGGSAQRRLCKQISPTLLVFQTYRYHRRLHTTIARWKHRLVTIEHIIARMPNFNFIRYYASTYEVLVGCAWFCRRRHSFFRSANHSLPKTLLLCHLGFFAVCLTGYQPAITDVN